MTVDIAALKARIGKSKKSTSDVKRTLGAWTSTPFLSRDRKTEALIRGADGQPVVVPFLRIVGIRQGFSLSAVLELVAAAEQALDAVAMALDHADDPATIAALLDNANASAAPAAATPAPVASAPAAATPAPVASAPAAPANMSDKLAALVAGRQRS